MKVREVCMCAWKGFGKGEKKCPAWFCLLVLNPPTDTQLSSIDEEHTKEWTSKEEPLTLETHSEFIIDKRKLKSRRTSHRLLLSCARTGRVRVRERRLREKTGIGKTKRKWNRDEEKKKKQKKKNKERVSFPSLSPAFYSLLSKICITSTTPRLLQLTTRVRYRLPPRRACEPTEHDNHVTEPTLIRHAVIFLFSHSRHRQGAVFANDAKGN